MAEDALYYNALDSYVRDAKPGDVVVIESGRGSWDGRGYKKVRVSKIGGAGGSLIFTDDGRVWKRNGRERGDTGWYGDSLRSVKRPDLLEAFLTEAARARAEEKERAAILALIDKTKLRDLSIDTLRAIRVAINGNAATKPTPTGGTDGEG